MANNKRGFVWVVKEVNDLLIRIEPVDETLLELVESRVTLSPLSQKLEELHVVRVVNWCSSLGAVDCGRGNAGNQPAELSLH